MVTMFTARYEGTLGDTGWQDNHDEWNAERYTLEFWHRSLAYVTRRWGHLAAFHAVAQYSDLQGIATETLVDGARAWFGYCEDTANDPTAKRLFWWFIKQRIDWAVIRYNKEKARNTDSINHLESRIAEGTGGTEWLATQIARSFPPSTLHADIANFIPTLAFELEIVLALYYFEELPIANIAEIIGLKPSAISTRIGKATTRIVHHAHGLVLNQAPPPMSGYDTGYLPPPSLTDWIRQRYDTDPITYLRYVHVHYQADVTYLVDFANRANGITHARGHPGPHTNSRPWNTKINDQQLTEIQARLAAGDTGRAIAADYGVAESVVSKIKTGFRKIA